MLIWVLRINYVKPLGPGLRRDDERQVNEPAKRRPGAGRDSVA